MLCILWDKLRSFGNRNILSIWLTSCYYRNIWIADKTESMQEIKFQKKQTGPWFMIKKEFEFEHKWISHFRHSEVQKFCLFDENSEYAPLSFNSFCSKIDLEGDYRIK